MYSTTVSQLVNSIESHSNFDSEHPYNNRSPSRDGDSIGTRSIANSSGSQGSSCKSISDPTVLLSKAILDLKRSAREKDEMSEEYWDTWNYWKRHPFVNGNVLLSGQLLLEHLLILNNINFQDYSIIFQELSQWLSLTTTITSSNDFTKIKDQLCAGFFLIYCKNFDESRNYLEKIKNFILPEYFEALKGELENRRDEEELKEENLVAKKSFSLKNLFLFLKEFALFLLEKMKFRHFLIVNSIKSNGKSFVLFCKKLVEILLKKMRIII